MRKVQRAALHPGFMRGLSRYNTTLLTLEQCPLIFGVPLKQTGMIRSAITLALRNPIATVKDHIPPQLMLRSICGLESVGLADEMRNIHKSARGSLYDAETNDLFMKDGTLNDDPSLQPVSSEALHTVHPSPCACTYSRVTELYCSENDTSLQPPPRRRTAILLGRGVWIVDEPLMRPDNAGKVFLFRRAIALSNRALRYPGPHLTEALETHRNRCACLNAGKVTVITRTTNAPWRQGSVKSVHPGSVDPPALRSFPSTDS